MCLLRDLARAESRGAKLRTALRAGKVSAREESGGKLQSEASPRQESSPQAASARCWVYLIGGGSIPVRSYLLRIISVVCSSTQPMRLSSSS